MRSPEALDGLSWLTLRFFGDEDYVWTASPLTGNVRQMTGSNRSDTLFAGAFSPDDFMVWSGKVELLEGSSVKLIPLLVPVIETPWGELKGSDGCAGLTIDPKGTLRLNSETVRFPGLPGWIPTNALFVVRPVWRLELSTTDPFSLDARQTLYIDAATMLPVYRTVWDEGGRLRRFTTGVLGTIVLDGVSVPVWRGQLMVSPADSTRSTLVPTDLSVCSKLMEQRDLRAFDPGHLAPPKQGTPVAAAGAKRAGGVSGGGEEPEQRQRPEPTPATEAIEDPDAGHGE